MSSRTEPEPVNIYGIDHNKIKENKSYPHKDNGNSKTEDEYMQNTNSACTIKTTKGQITDHRPQIKEKHQSRQEEEEQPITCSVPKDL